MSTEQHTLTMTREFDAPRERVFDAWMDPDQLTKWFGPAGVDSPRETIVIDPRVGGVWQVVMTWTEGDETKEGPIDAVITELNPPALLVASAKSGEESSSDELEMRLEFEDLDGRTRLVMTQGPFESEEWVDMTREGWGTSFDKLDGLLA